MVVGILALMAVVAMAVFSDVKAKSRDSRRLKDIRTLHEALAMYLDSHKTYPLVVVSPPGIAVNGSDVVSADLKNDGILKSNLSDPQAGQTIGGEVFNYYYYTDVQGKTYTITFCLETTSIAGKVKGCGNRESP